MNKKHYYGYGHYAGFSEKDMDYYMENKIIKPIEIEQMLWRYSVDEGSINYWDKGEDNYFTKEDVINYCNSGREDTEESDNNTTEDGYPKCDWDKNYHIKRIVYFMRHPDYIKGIDTFVGYSIGQKCYDVIDGMHRILAGLCLGMTTIEGIVLNEEIDHLRKYKNTI